MTAKRVGRPVVAATPGERAGLSLRVTPEVKERLEKAAEKHGRSLSQEAEFRLERSLYVDQHLMLARGDGFAPVAALGLSGLLVMLDDGVVALKISKEDLRRLRDFFRGAPHPVHHFRDDGEEEWLPLDIREDKNKTK
jgi:hypothetical protein